MGKSTYVKSVINISVVLTNVLVNINNVYFYTLIARYYEKNSKFKPNLFERKE